MWLTLERDSIVPMGRQIYEAVKAMILRGELAAGERLPSSRSLARELDVSRNTALDAYDRLLAEGYLVARHGSGTVVADGIATDEMESGGSRRDLSVGGERPVAADAGVIDFSSGIPDVAVFPRKDWGTVYRRACESLPDSAFRYAAAEGVWALREAIAAWLFRVRGIRTVPGRIMITSGSTQGLSLISGILYRKGTTVLVEDPVHKGLVSVVGRAGYTITGIPADEYGMDTARLDGLGSDLAKNVSFAYVTPSHNYPLGGILPVQRRQSLIRFVKRAGCYIVEDDYDSEFRYSGAPVSSLYELAPEKVIYLGSFSKILTPAMRLGFAILPHALVDEWKPEKKYSDVHTDALSQYALAAFIDSGALERHIWKMKKRYGRKREHLIQCLKRHFGDGFTITGEAAGLHLVAGFPGVDFTGGLTRELLLRGIWVVPVEDHSICRDGSHAHEIVLGYSHLSASDMEKGIAILSGALGSGAG